MTTTSYELDADGDQIREVVMFDGNILGEKKGHLPLRQLRLTVDDGQVYNDDNDAETVTIEVVDGLAVARGTGPSNATVLDYNGDMTVAVDGQQITKTLTSGAVSFDVTTTKPAGSKIEIVAKSLSDHHAKSDSATIEVVSP